MRALLLALLLSFPVCAQTVVMTGAQRKIFATASATPGFVSETSKDSTLTGQVKSLVSGTTTCAAYTGCINSASPILSDNLTVDFFTADNGTSTMTSPTAVNDKSDSFTCLTGTVQTATDIGAGVCYKAGTTAGAYLTKITWGTTAQTNVQAKVQQFDNVALSGAVDTSEPCNGVATTSPTCGSITTTAANDLIDVMICSTASTYAAPIAFTPGASYSVGTREPHDGCNSEYYVASSAGSYTPSGTFSASSAFVGYVVAFKSASAGTAPSGWYLRRLESYSTPETIGPGTITYNWDWNAGDLIVETNSCNTLSVTQATDSVNGNWTLNAAALLGYNEMNEAYVNNASANSAGPETITTTGASGNDCTQQFYDWAGAPATVYTSRSQWNLSLGRSTGFLSGVQYLYDSEAYDPSNVGPYPFGRFLGIPTTGISMTAGSENLNTSLSVTSPSICLGDMSVQGGENRDGPWWPDQNNLFGHCSPSGTTASTYLAVPLSSSSTSPNGYGADMLSFFGSAGTAIVNSVPAQATSASSLPITVPATTAGNLIHVDIQVYNPTAQTILHACFDGTTCAAGNALTCTATSTGSGHGATTICYINSAPAGKTTLTVTASGSAANLEADYFEVQSGSGTWSLDNSASTTNGTGSGNTVSLPSITTTGSVDFCSAVVAVSGDGMGKVATNPTPELSGNEYIYGGTIWTNDDNAAISLLTLTAGAHQPKFYDKTSGDSFSGSHVCSKR
jgi:hypothetical protein